MVCTVTKFDDAYSAELLLALSGEFDASSRAAEGNSREAQTRIPATAVRGARSSALKELWQSSLCADDKPAHGREPQSEAQSGATSIATKVKIAIARRGKSALRGIFMINITRYARRFVESTCVLKFSRESVDPSEDTRKALQCKCERDRKNGDF